MPKPKLKPKTSLKQLRRSKRIHHQPANKSVVIMSELTLEDVLGEPLKSPRRPSSKKRKAK